MPASDFLFSVNAGTHRWRHEAPQHAAAQHLVHQLVKEGSNAPAAAMASSNRACTRYMRQKQQTLYIRAAAAALQCNAEVA
jgi:ferric-dicitrate binding protein FerR (iron transport regulator)